MDGNFFGFGATLPPGVDDDPGHGLEEEEEEYDALNDETFGTTGGEDWEENHEALARLAEGSRQQEGINDVNHNQDSITDHDDIKNGQELEASLTQLVLEDSDDLTIKNRSSQSHRTHSNLAPYPGTPSALQNSVWAVGKHDVTSPLSTSSPIRPRSALPQGVKNVCTVEELERNLLQMRSGDTGNSTLPTSNPGVSIPLRLEDVERKMTQTVEDVERRMAQVPQPRFNMPPDTTIRPPPGLGRSSMLLNILHNQRLMGPPGRIDPPKIPLQQIPLGFGNSNLNPPLGLQQQHTFQPIRHGSGLIQLGAHQQPHLPFNVNGPRLPPFHLNSQLMPPQAHQHLIHQQLAQHPQQHMQHLQQLRVGGNNTFQQLHPHHYFQAQHQHGNHYLHHQQHHQHHRVNGAGDFDEYAGMMTPWQKQWLLNIQTLQLNVGVPYIVDYYYTVYNDRQLTRKNSEKLSSPPDRPGTIPDSAKLGRDRPESTKPGRDRPPSVMGPAKAYTPLQFENSLGKLQCVSVTAPRKLIDMEVMSPEGPDSPSSQRDIRKTKQLLLEIERLFVLLLELEDAFNPLAMQAAAEAAAAKAMRDTPDADVEPEKSSPEDLLQRMTSVLLQADKIQGFMGIRKGKTFLLRLLPHVPLDMGLHTAVWSQILVGLSGLVRRDHTDGLLLRFLPEFNRWLDACELPQVLKLTSSLVAEASPKAKSSKSALATSVGSKFGVMALACLLTTVEKHLKSMDEDQTKQWFDFMISLTNAAETSKVTEDNSIQLTLPNILSTLQSHIDFCEPVISNKQAALLKHLFTNSGANSENETKTESVLSSDKTAEKGTKLTLLKLSNKEQRN